MAIVKEYTCDGCGGYQFEGISDNCPLCGVSAKRAFRTPPGYITKHLVRNFESVLGQELADRGLSDLPKPKDVSDYEPRDPRAFQEVMQCSGSNQDPITPKWGRNQVPPQIGSPDYTRGESRRVVDTNPPPNFLRERTQIIARIDKDGNRIG